MRWSRPRKAILLTATISGISKSPTFPIFDRWPEVFRDCRRTLRRVVSIYTANLNTLLWRSGLALPCSYRLVWQFQYMFINIQGTVLCCDSDRVYGTVRTPTICVTFSVIPLHVMSMNEHLSPSYRRVNLPRSFS